jgi:Leucine-rich repeat (LRR) protein
LLEGMEVDVETGEVVRNKRFTGTEPAQIFLDVAMYSLLSVAPDGSRAATLRAAVRKIDIKIAVMPELAGYETLDELRLSFTHSFNSLSLDGLGYLPALRTLIVRPETKNNRPMLESLGGLDAPALENLVVRDMGLKDVDALFRCASLKSVDLSENPLDSIEGLATSSSSLIELLLENCSQLKSLDPLTGATSLRCVRLKNSGIKSLQPLTGCSQIDQLTLEGCENLTSLKGLACQPLVGPDVEVFSLRRCRSMKSLAGLPRLSSIVHTLDLSLMYELSDLSGIEAASTITHLNAKCTQVTDLTPLLSLKELVRVDLANCEKLTDASPLGDLRKLKSLRLINCLNLRTLPDPWPSNFAELAIHGCKELASLGSLPHSLKKIARVWHDAYENDSSRLDLSGCNKLNSLAPLGSTNLAASTTTVDLSGCISLETLSGLESMTYLKTIILPTSITDASAILHLRGLDITVHSGSEVSIPEALGCALAELTELNVTVNVQTNDNLVDCSSLGALKAVVAIDLSACPKIADLTWITGLVELTKLQIDPNSPAGKKAKVAKLDNQIKVRQLQQTICAENKLPLPSHLSTANKEKRLTEKRKPGMLTVKHLKAGLTSPHPDEVSKALSRLFKEGDAPLYDELVDGCDIKQAYTGNSEAIGKLFKSVKAPDRPLARWALTSILAAAPEEASVARNIRQGIRQLVLNFRIFDAAEAPSLTGFMALEQVTLEEFPGITLATLTGLRQIRQLSVKGAPGLISLAGIEDASGLEKLDISGSPSLVDLTALAGKPALTGWSSLVLELSPHADLTPLAELPSIASLAISCEGPLPDLSPLVYVSMLTYKSTPKGDNGVSAPSVKQPALIWKYTLPSLTDLQIDCGSHDFSSLDAPELKYFHISGRWNSFEETASLLDLRGLGKVGKFYFSSTEVSSLNGLQGSPATELNLCNLKGRLEDVSALREMAALRELKLPRDAAVLSDKARSYLLGLVQIERLQLQNFSGSLAFLVGWNALRELDLRHSGALIDLEILAELPKLEQIFLRDAQLKRESWPEILQAKLEYVRVP